MQSFRVRCGDGKRRNIRARSRGAAQRIGRETFAAPLQGDVIQGAIGPRPAYYAGVRFHDVKEHIDYFKDLAFHGRTFEIRCADRDYRVGDYLLVREWDNLRSRYTGATRLHRIEKIYAPQQIAPVPSLMDGMVLLHLGPVPGGIHGVIETSQRSGVVRGSKAADASLRAELDGEHRF